MNLYAEKLDQAVTILNELDLDAWLIFVRESSENGDPALPLVHGGDFTWQTALLVFRDGHRAAIVGKFDDGPLRAAGNWTEVVAYVEGIQQPLLSAIESRNPRSIAVDYSTDDHTADGLSHGMYLKLLDYLDGTPFGERLVSAAPLLTALRGRKSAVEIDRMQRAIHLTEAIFEEVSRFAKVGKTERQIAQFIQARATDQGLETAWQAPCPIVNTGPDSMVGHGVPSDLAIEPGHLLHIDFGVKVEGYCADLQRCWYVPKAGESAPPSEVQRGFDAVRDGIDAAFRAVKPGMEGWQIDDVARKWIADAGYPEYGHALGHHVGRTAHDGGGILGPRWPRYGQTPYLAIEAGNVFTIEPSIEDVAGRGCLGLEEMVLVTDDGCRWMSKPQQTLPCLGN